MSRKRHSAADEAHFIVRSLAAIGLPGRSIRPHTHPWHQLIFAASGVMTVWTDQGSWIVPPQWAIWAPAGVAHGMTFSGHTSLRTLYVKPADWPALPVQSTVIRVSDFLRALIVRTVEVGMLDRRNATHAALALLLIDAFHAHPVAALDLPLPTSRRLRALTQDFLVAPNRELAIDRAARRAGLGIRSFERRFLAETGITFGRWQRQARLTEALRQLAAGHSVKSVAGQAGYRSTSAFVNAFSRMFGTTPGRYFINANPNDVNH